MSPIPIYVTFFGSDPRFSEMLRRFLDCAACYSGEIRILTDEHSTRVSGHRVHVVSDEDLAPFSAVMRPGNPYDRKSAMICAALPHLPPCAIVDVDMEFLRNPWPVLEPYTRNSFAIAPDAGKRMIPVGPVSYPEESSSLMLFGGTARKVIVEEYVRAWESLRFESNEHSLEFAIREQRAWSLVSRYLDEEVLPDSLNWSRFWGPPREDTCIVHHHGEAKWRFVAR
jgi:hypothetical protein